MLFRSGEFCRRPVRFRRRPSDSWPLPQALEATPSTDGDLVADREAAVADDAAELRVGAGEDGEVQDATEPGKIADTHSDV